MEVRSLQSPTVTSIPRIGLIEKRLACIHTFNLLRYTKRHPNARKLKLLDIRVQPPGTTKFSSGTVEAVPKDFNLKVEDVIFVAGATGRVGSRTVRELLKLGFKVRAGVRSAQRAESLVQSVKQIKLDQAASMITQSIENLEIVECDLEKPDQIGLALGNASVVICCIGASEKEVFDITGPYRIDYQATRNLIDAATVAKVNHFILLTSLGTNKIGFPAAVLNLFWGVLIWKRKAEEALLASGLPYTIVRPGGMERPTDSYKETHNIALSQEDTLFGGQVSNLQVAELMAFMAKNRSLSYCKVVEVIAETTAPLTPMGELLAKIPSQRVDISPIKEPSAEVGPTTAVSEGTTSESPITAAEKEPARAKATAARPLSPYNAYEDLKPPSSPSPRPSSSKEIPSGFSRPAAVSLPFAGGNDVAQIEAISAVEKDTLQTVNSRHSPYLAYYDLKPPTSPSPNARSMSFSSNSPISGDSQVGAMSGNNTHQPPAAEKAGNTHHHAEPKPRPLSPFTMYEDTKPPTSPSPSPRKL